MGNTIQIGAGKHITSTIGIYCCNWLSFCTVHTETIKYDCPFTAKRNSKLFGCFL